MATSLMRFRGRGFWIGHGSAEVWFARLVEHLGKSAQPEWVNAMVAEIQEALDAPGLSAL